MRAALLTLAALAAAAPFDARRRALRVGNWNQRLHAVHEFEADAAANTAALAEAAEDADWQVRMTAVHALGRAGSAGLPALEEVLRREPCRAVRLTALHWLGVQGEAGEAAMRRALTDESGMVRLMGRYWLEKSGASQPPEAWDATAAAKEDLASCAGSFAPGKAAWAAPKAALSASAELPVRDEVVVTPDPPEPAAPERPGPETLPGASGLPGRPEPPRGSAEFLPASRERLRELDELLGGEAREPETMPPGPRGFGDRPAPETAGADYAAVVAGGKPEGDPVPALRALLKHRDPARRARAADELGKVGGAAAPAREDLVAALADASPRVRAAAALALGGLGAAGEPAVPALTRLLKKGPDEAEWAAAVALSRIGTPRASRALARHARAAAENLARRRAPR